MLLPKEISPNPVIISTVEIRFKSSISQDDVFNVFHKLFQNEFPKIKPHSLSKVNSITINGINTPLAGFIFSSNDYSVSVGNNIISFENIGTYHLWSNYFPIMKECLNKLGALNVITEIERIGVRYASIIENEESVFDVFDVPFKIQYDGYSQAKEFFRTELDKENITLILQIADKANVKRNEMVYSGTYIDIDASTIYNLPNEINDEIYNLIDKLHSEEKKLFFSLLKKEVLAKLNPKY